MKHGKYGRQYLSFSILLFSYFIVTTLYWHLIFVLSWVDKSVERC